MHSLLDSGLVTVAVLTGAGWIQGCSCGERTESQVREGVGDDRDSYPIADSSWTIDPGSGRDFAALFRELMQRAEQASPAEPADAEEAWRLALREARRFERDPIGLLRLFSSSDRGYVAQYWLVRQQLTRVEAEVDRKLGAGAWRELTDDYRTESLIAATIPHVHTALARFEELRLVPDDDANSSVVATLDDPRTGIYVLCIEWKDERLCLGSTAFHLAASGIDYYFEGSTPSGVPIVLKPGGGWKTTSSCIVDELWTILAEPTTSGQELEQRLRASMDARLTAFASAVIARFPPGVVGVIMDNWARNNPVPDTPSAGFSIPTAAPPILTPFGVNPDYTNVPLIR